LSIVVPAPSQPTVFDDPKNDIILRSSEQEEFSLLEAASAVGTGGVRGHVKGRRRTSGGEIADA
jgi:hypothetical protein